jgi:ribosomal protein S18 acetylase RimI-like enzyme
VKNNEIETFRTVFNEAFSERPGFTPYTRDRFARIYLDKPYVDLTGYFVIVTEDGNIVGTVANIIDTEYARISSKYGYGKIRALGVLKNHRGKGLGKTLLLKSVYWHKHKGIRIIGLGVDSDNYVALNLYKSMGFKIRREFLRYEREI